MAQVLAPSTAAISCTGRGGNGSLTGRSRDELERDAVDVRVLGVEALVVVDGVGAATQATADDLLAQQLAAERA